MRKAYVDDNGPLFRRNIIGPYSLFRLQLWLAGYKIELGYARALIIREGVKPLENLFTPERIERLRRQDVLVEIRE